LAGLVRGQSHGSDRSSSQQGGYLLWRVKELGVSIADREESVIQSQLPVPTFYLEWKRGVYWRDINAGRENLPAVYQFLNETACCRKLREARLSPVANVVGTLSAVEKELIRIADHASVDWVGRLAGYQPGLLRMNESDVLITSGPNLVKPVEGKWPVITRIINGMLGDGQKWYLYYWMKVYLEALWAWRTQHGQLVIFCGPRDTMKSFFQHHILTPLFGGREADAARYLSGKTEFNADLCGAEHNFLDDAKPYGNWMSRHDFAENLKSMIVGKGTSVHGKHRDGETFCPRRRITMSINSDDDAIRSLPDITESFADKVMLFDCKDFALPMPNFTAEEKSAFESAIAAEIPHLAHWLINLTISESYRSARFGVTHYHAPLLLEKLHAMSREAKLSSLINMADLEPSTNPLIVKGHGRAWVGTSQELEQELMAKKNTRSAAEHLLKWDNSTGILLERLSKALPKAVTAWRHKVDGAVRRDWIVKISEWLHWPRVSDRRE
jgi:hypothetical protein